MSENKQTPRTDGQAFIVYPYQMHGQIVGNKAVAVDFARQLETELAEAQAEIERLKDCICYANKTNQSCDFPKLQEQQKLIEQMRNAIKGALRSADAEWESKNQGHDWAEACIEMRGALEAAKGAK